MFSLEGKTALITGATGGIGEAIARMFHQAGANIVISGTRGEVLNNLVTELKERIFPITTNLKDSNDTNELFGKAEKVFGQIDILVCNAGITRDNLMIRLKDEDFDEVINVNLKSAFILNREALKSMMKRRYGRIINISSVVALTGNFGQTNYVASKAGLIGMTKSVALEGASRNITANCIAPGFIVSAMTDKISDDMKNTLKLKIPLNFFGEPKDIASAALYLASDEARYVTGTTLNVNGGMNRD